MLLVALDDDHADEVIEPFVGVALDVEVDVNGGIGELRRPEHVDPLVPHGEGLKGMVAMIVLRRGTLASPPRDGTCGRVG